MKKLNYELKTLCRHNKDGSYATQHGRHNILQLAANQLPLLGYTHMGAASLKPKHIETLVKQWQSEGLSIGTLKQRLSALRWWAEKICKPNIIARDNAFYGIGPRQVVSSESKARALDQEKLDKINDSYTRASLRLQAAFGLRREEAIKFIPRYADQGDCIRLKASWTKGGKERRIPVRTTTQRALLDELKQTFGASALIPPNRRYVEQLRLYEKQTARAELHKMHGLRHAYAQHRYLELTGWPCSVCGGPTCQQLSIDQQQQDKEARLLISKELGHERREILSIYIGR